MSETQIPIYEMVLRLAAAAGFALLLGLERELSAKPAGIRSHMLVSLGACAFMLIGMQILLATAQGDPSAQIDPTRIVEGVIGGIGFLGAGSIIRSGTNVHGITTGAAIWTAGAIGVACGVGNIILAGMLTTLAILIIVVLGYFEHKIVRKIVKET